MVHGIAVYVVSSALTLLLLSIHNLYQSITISISVNPLHIVSMTPISVNPLAISVDLSTQLFMIFVKQQPGFDWCVSDILGKSVHVFYTTCHSVDDSGIR